MTCICPFVSMNSNHQFVSMKAKITHNESIEVEMHAFELAGLW